MRWGRKNCDRKRGGRLWLLAACLVVLFAGCGTKEPQKEETKIRAAVMTGPTAIGMVKLMKDAEEGTASQPCQFQVCGTADEIMAGLMKGELDIACVPCNLAAVLNRKTEGEIVIGAVNTLGVLYIVETGETLTSVEELKGRTIYSTGQGSTPEYTLRYLLTLAGLDPDKDVTIIYKSEAAEVAAMLSDASDAVAMLPQPYVTIAMNQNPKLRIALDVTEEWEKRNDSTVVTGVMVARKSFIEENEEAFAEFMEEYERSAACANENTEQTAEALEHFGIFKAAVARKAIPYCNVVFFKGNEMKEKVLAYLQVIYEQKPEAVGNAAPGEELFYSAE